jgi:DNA-binding GntR family transcriptional regulator
MAIIEAQHAQGERYLRLKLDMPIHKRQSDEEHHQIFKALRAGKVDRAIHILQEHLLQTGELLGNYLAQHLATRSVKREPRKLNRASTV